MNPLTVVVVLVAIVAVATGLGLLYKRLQGRARRDTRDEIVAIDGVTLGADATLLQFSTTVCAPCVATARVLHAVALEHPGTSHVEIDVTDRPELASRFNLFQTPTTFVLDSEGVLRARIGGAVRRDTVVAELARALEPAPRAATDRSSNVFSA